MSIQQQPLPFHRLIEATAKAAKPKMIDGTRAFIVDFQRWEQVFLRAQPAPYFNVKDAEGVEYLAVVVQLGPGYFNQRRYFFAVPSDECPKGNLDMCWDTPVVQLAVQ